MAVFAVLVVMMAVPSSRPRRPQTRRPARAAAVCADHRTQAEAQNAADTIDADGDGRYCEALPCPCTGATRMPRARLVPQGTRTEAQAKPNRAAVRRAKLPARPDGGASAGASGGSPASSTATRCTSPRSPVPRPARRGPCGIDVTPETVKPGSPVECGGPEATSALLERAFTAPVDTNLDGLYDTPGGEGRRVRLRTDVTQDLYDARGRVLSVRRHAHRARPGA